MRSAVNFTRPTPGTSCSTLATAPGGASFGIACIAIATYWPGILGRTLDAVTAHDDRRIRAPVPECATRGAQGFAVDIP